MTQLVILEDAPVRLKLFQLELADVDYQITDDVHRFLDLVKEAEDAETLRLIIMDHDLGHPLEGGRRLNFDKNGLSGTEAAEMLRTKHPVLIWSANTKGAQRMKKTLTQKGIKAVYMPIWQSNEIASVLRRVFPPG